MTDDNEEFEGTLHLDINAARHLRELLKYFIETWPGSPARPPEEQEFARVLQSTVNQIILEHNYVYLDQKDDTGTKET